MKPVDPRLLRYARATRIFLAGGPSLLGAGRRRLIVAQATLIAEVVVGGFQHGTAPAHCAAPLLLLAAVAVRPRAGRPG